MSDLINIGLSATRAVSASLRMVGENIANADDPAYVRRRVLLTEATMPTRGSPLYRTQVSTGGVEIAGIGRSVDPLADAALRRAQSVHAETSERADWFTRIEGALDDGDYGVGARITAFFSAGARAVATPTDSALRIDMLSELGRVGEGFAQTAQRIDALDTDLDGALSNSVSALNGHMSALAAINRDLRAARPGSAAQAQLFDRRDLAVREITQLLPADISTDRFGVATLTIGGVDIVAGITAETLGTTRTPGGGIALTTSTAISVAINGGQFAGLHAAGEALRQRRLDLDAQAAMFVTEVNAWNGAGTTPLGGAGGPLLAGNSATTITLSSVDPAAIAAATPGGNPAGNLIALTNLRGDNGGEERWRLFNHRNAVELRNVRADADAATIMKDQAAALRDNISGVDLDQEAAEMLRLQQAYGAAARVLQVARDTVQTILDIV